MKKFEYRVMSVPINLIQSKIFIDGLNGLGAAGWELVSVYQELSSPFIKDVSNFSYYFKREIQ